MSGAATLTVVCLSSFPSTPAVTGAVHSCRDRPVLMSPAHLSLCWYKQVVSSRAVKYRALRCAKQNRSRSLIDSVDDIHRNESSNHSISIAATSSNHKNNNNHNHNYHNLHHNYHNHNCHHQLCNDNDHNDR